MKYTVKRDANIGKKEMVIYLLGAYGISGLFAMPLILNSKIDSGMLYLTLMGIATFGPFMSSLAVTYYFQGLRGIRRILKNVVNWKFPWYLYILIFFLPGIFMISGISLNIAIGGISPIVWVMFPNTFITAVVSPLGEELGWRGFMMPRLQKYLSPILTSLILGVIWAGWHYWLFLIPGIFSNELPFHIFLASCIANTLWYTWFYNKSNHSILTGILFHFSFNMTNRIIPISPEYYEGSYTPYLIMIILEILLGISINLLFKNKTNLYNHASKKGK